MSWFTRPFALREEDEEKRGGEEEENEDDEEEEDDEDDDSLNFSAIASATGATVKEDLSNLTKTFTRQLWGVASFLAPPPLETSVRPEDKEEGVAFAQELKIEGSRDDAGIRSASSGVAITVPEDDGQGFTELRFGDLESNFSPVAVSPPSHAFASGATVSKDDEANVALVESRQGSGEHRLPGFRSDFEELRGSVATGLSRLSNAIRVVTGEDTSGEESGGHVSGTSTRESSHLVTGSTGGDQHMDSPRHVFDSFIKPLFGNMLMREDLPEEKENVQSEETEKSVGFGQPHSEGDDMPLEMDPLPNAIANGIDGLSKFAVNVLKSLVQDDDEDRSAEDDPEGQNLQFGLTDSVVLFARNIAMHPETWLDFPYTKDDAKNDFEMTEAQREHIRALEIAAPALIGLKVELCPTHMTEKRFWKIYFVLMHSRLSSNEADMQPDVQVVRARASMLEELQKEAETDELRGNGGETPNKQVEIEVFGSGQSGRNPPDNKVGLDYMTQTYSSALGVPSGSSSFEGKRLWQERRGVDDAVDEKGETKLSVPTSESGKAKFSTMNVEDDTEVNEWLDDESASKGHGVGVRSYLDASLDEDVSFSDLEEDEPLDRATGMKGTIASSSAKSSGSALKRGESSTQLGTGESSGSSTQGDSTPRKSSEFNDWLTVNQDDVVSAGSSSP